MAGRFEDKVVLITGAASGIGAATARRFAGEGARLMLGDIDTQGGDALARELGESAAFRATDVRDRAQVEALTDEAVDRFGRLDVLFNNAGAGALGQTPDIDPAEPSSTRLRYQGWQPIPGWPPTTRPRERW